VDKSPDAFRTISEVAEDLDLPQHVLRFWETRFNQIKPLKRGGGRRYYRPDDVELLRGIRHLLYGEGHTIRGVQRILKEEGSRFVQGIWRAENGGGDSPPLASDLDGEDNGSVSFLDEAEPVLSDGADSHAAAPLPPDLRQRLEAAMRELAECRRLILMARGRTGGEDEAS
jgi:DNA-binding transcriptional MerR regulator